MDDMEEIEVLVNGSEEIWPKREHLDYKAWQYGFEDYEDLKGHGYSLEKTVE